MNAHRGSRARSHRPAHDAVPAFPGPEYPRHGPARDFRKFADGFLAVHRLEQRMARIQIDEILPDRVVDEGREDERAVGGNICPRQMPHRLVILRREMREDGEQANEVECLAGRADIGVRRQ